MTRLSQLLTPFHNNQREACPVRSGFYDCGGFVGCCPTSPCLFTDERDPCAAAIDHLNDDGHDGDASSTVKTITASLPDFTSADPETFSIDHPKTSTEDADHWSSSSHSSSSSSSPPSSSAKPSLHSSIAASTTSDGTTLSTSVVSTSVSSSPTATETLPAPVPTASPQNGSGSDKSLPDAAIAGVSVIGAIGGIMLLALFFWFARRRRLSKRMSSIRGNSPIPPPDMKLTVVRHPSLTGTALGYREALIECNSPSHCTALGYREALIKSENIHRPYTRRCVVRDPGGAWHVRNASAPEADSLPTHAELDSAEMQRPTPTLPRSLSVDITKPLPRRPSVVNTDNHPSQLVPGLPTAVQNNNRSADVSQNHRDSANAPRAVPRATLNATDDERMNNLYANSWANGP